MDALQRSIPSSWKYGEVCGCGRHQGSGNQYMEDFAWILVPGASGKFGDRHNHDLSKTCVPTFSLHCGCFGMLWDALGCFGNVVACCGFRAVVAPTTVRVIGRPLQVCLTASLRHEQMITNAACRRGGQLFVLSTAGRKCADQRVLCSERIRLLRGYLFLDDFSTVNPLM